MYFDMDPVLLRLGPVAIHWYGLMYLLGFSLAFWYCYKHRDCDPQKPWTVDALLDLFFYASLGVIFGGTWGYLLVYQPEGFLADPLQALRFWAPGRSFHGGLVGVILAVYVFARYTERSFWDICDFIAPAVPLGIAAGRLGNFINGELWGRLTRMPWGIHFPGTGLAARHPSALYECALEGVVLFIVLYVYSRQARPRGAISAAFLIGYGLLRMLAECFREPDWQQGFVIGDCITLGQVLCIPMILAGLWILGRAQARSPLGGPSCDPI